MLNRKKIKFKRKILYNGVLILVILSSCKKSFFVSSSMSYTLIQFECFQSFRYARRRSEVTVNDRLSAAAPISLSMLKVRRLLGRGAYFNCG